MSQDNKDGMADVTDGLIAVVKRDCPTCVLVAPALWRLAAEGGALAVYSQDDPSFPEGIDGVVDDVQLKASFNLDIEIVPTLIRMEGGREAARAVGWNREEWRGLTGIADLGADLPENRPGCGSRTEEPGMRTRLRVRFGNTGLASRRIEVPFPIDPAEAAYDRGWSDGLPVVPPTEARVLDMLDGTPRAPDEIVGLIPPRLAECTVEKVAINAVMAGCRPDYMPVVLAALDAALDPDFNLHGLIATTCAVAPVVMVNGPIAKAIGMNPGLNVFGQGNRAHAAIGRTLNLLIRNVGGGLPGEVDRAAFGNAGKYSFCFAEDEADGVWETYAESLGYPRTVSTVTLFAGDGVQPVIDHVARTPEELCESYRGCIRAIYLPGQIWGNQCFLVVGYEHARVFYDAGWSKQRLKDELLARLRIPLAEVAPGRAGLLMLSEEEKADPDATFSKFHRGSFNIIRAGGHAGKYSALITAVGGTGVMDPTTREITA